jgi:anthranilate synthase component 1
MLRRGVDAPVTSLGAHRSRTRIRQGRLSESRRQAHEYVLAGDLMQVQIGQRIRKPMSIRR